MQRSEAATITTSTTTRQELKDGQGEELKSCSILVDHVSVKKVPIRFQVVLRSISSMKKFTYVKSVWIQELVMSRDRSDV